MSEPTLTCEQVRLLLSLGEPGADHHLSQCRLCRHEAERLAPILGALRTQPAVEVPTQLDHFIRAMLTGPPAVTESRLHLPIALSLSTAATVALIAGFMITLFNMYPESQAIARGLVLAVTYAAITSVATLPLFLRRTRPRLEAQQWT